MTFVKKTITSFVLIGIVPLVSLGATACSGRSSTPTAETSPSDSSMAQMDHGSMGSPSESGSMPMNNGSMMNMDLGPTDANFDLRFIDGMTPHHEGAVAMAQEALQKSNRSEIRQLAQAIIDAQEQEISQFKEWRTAWYPNVGDEPTMYNSEMRQMMPMTGEMRSSMMMEGSLGEADDQFDLRFINAMTVHHKAAIDMAKQALEKSDRSEIKEVAQNIIDSQQQETDQMTQWKQEWYNQ